MKFHPSNRYFNNSSGLAEPRPKRRIWLPGLNKLLRQVFGLTILLSLGVWPTVALADDPVPLTLNPSAWISDDSNTSSSVAWGDVDGDGDLDLAVGNHTASNQLYLNAEGTLALTATWTSDEAEATYSTAWGDVDNDGDLDLAVGNENSRNQIYLNNDGFLATTALDISIHQDATHSVAWGDVNDDGWLDLAVGNFGEQNKIYLNNQSGVLLPVPGWQSTESDNTHSLAWSDVNGDGRLDLAVGNEGGPNRVYLNTGTTLETTASWSSQESDGTFSVAWGDVDGNGHLDLAVGNNVSSTSGQKNRLYLNDGTGLAQSASWSSTEADITYSVAWGDVDNDGDLDLAVGNGHEITGFSNKVYLNEGGVLQQGADWVSNDNSVSTYSVAWGDIDNDGDLDLAAGNLLGVANGVYRNDKPPLSTTSVWAAADDGTASTWDIAWGDVNGDDRLDLVTTHIEGEHHLYLNSDAGLETTASWLSSDSAASGSAAWGDVDGDGDLDLATASSPGLGFENRVYTNLMGQLQTFALWRNYTNFTQANAVAWGDVDGDGDLDLAVGNLKYSFSIPIEIEGASNLLYRNQGNTLEHTPLWFSVAEEISYDVAWGDMDNDGDLDLAVANGGATPDDGAQNRVYLNEGQTLQDTPAWSSSAAEFSNSVAWGDMNGDGYLDLAVGNANQVSRVYLNVLGMLQTTPIWSSADNEFTESVAWGDADGDGDLDLATANHTGPDKIYLNVGGLLQTEAAWSSQAAERTQMAVWGDVDNDGDLDLATTNGDSVNGSDGPSRVYLNPGRNTHPLIDNPPYVSLHRPGTTADANFFSTPEILSGPTITIEYTLFDPEGDSVPKIFPEYSPNGGGQWRPATPGSGGDGLTNLVASASGVEHTFVWDAAADLVKNDNLVFRLRAQPRHSYGPILWPALGAQSFSFRVEAAPWFVKVVDETGQALEGAMVYGQGQLITTTTAISTNKAGLIRLDNPTPGQPLVALHQIAEQPTTRAAHDGWAYRTYLTNLSLTGDGTPQPDTVGEPGEQRLVVREENPLVLFNLVASVEWDADEAYLAMLEDAFAKASDYLYDVTDGQMAFGQVSIYDKTEHWADADFQFSTKNTVRPYAFVGGLVSGDEAHTVRVGRFWNGESGNQGAWNEARGYRTLVHEFGHYALFLEDSYFLRQVDDNGNFTGQVDAFCTEESIVNNGSDGANATMMYYQYNATELSDKSYNWNENCLFTEQGRLNNNESDWETVRRHYPQLNTPTARGELMAGPAAFPTPLLPFPEIAMTNSGNIDGPSRRVTIQDEDGGRMANVLVALYTTLNGTTVAIDQGLSDLQGQIDVYGAVTGDTIQAATIDGALAGAALVGDAPTLDLTMFLTNVGSLTTQQSVTVPHLNLVPATDGDSLTLRVQGATAGPPLSAVVIPGEGAGSPQSTSLAYAPGDGTYSGNVSFAGVGLGTGRVRVSGDALPSTINSDYNLQAVRVITASHLYAEDGNFEMSIPPNGIPTDGYATTLPTGYVPGPLPNGLSVIGSAYEVRVSGALTKLKKNGLVRLHYHPQVMGAHSDIAIYYWDVAAKVWQPLGGEPSEVDHAYAIPTKRLGIYALMGVAIEVENEVYLPLIVK